MKKFEISAFQLFSLVVLFEFGTAIVISLASDARQDAWISILIALGIGLILVRMYLYIYQSDPQSLFSVILRKNFGKWIGYPLCLIYMGYFVYISSRVGRDIGALMTLSALPETPPYPLAILILLPVLFAVFLGIESIARSGEVFLYAICLLLGSGVFLVSISDIIQPDNLLPLLENGWKPILKSAFPLSTTFPFGETIVFLMILPALKTSSASTRTMLGAVTLSGFVIAGILLMNISVLGPDRMGRELFPLLTTIGKIHIGEFIQRLDALVISALIIGVFVKITLFLYAGFQIFLEITGLRNRKWILVSLLCLGIIQVLIAAFMADSLIQHIEIGLKIVPAFVHVPLQIGVPIVLTGLIFLSKRKKNNEKPA